MTTNNKTSPGEKDDSCCHYLVCITYTLHNIVLCSKQLMCFRQKKYYRDRQSNFFAHGSIYKHRLIAHNIGRQNLCSVWCSDLVIRLQIHVFHSLSCVMWSLLCNTCKGLTHCRINRRAAHRTIATASEIKAGFFFPPGWKFYIL